MNVGKHIQTAAEFYEVSIVKESLILSFLNVLKEETHFIS